MITEPTLYIAKDLIGRLGDNLQARRNTPDFSITSLPTLNQKIFGIPRKKLTIIGARPSHGKTSFMSQLAMDIAIGGAKVLILSYEESMEQLLERCFCNMHKVENRHLLRGRFVEYTNQFLSFSERIKKVPLALTDCAGKSCKELSDMIERMPQNARPDVIFVDYIQAIKGLGSLQQGAERTALDEYIKEFRKMCVHYNIAGVLMSQINRSTEIGKTKDTGPKTHQLKGTGFLEEHADLIILIHWLYKTTGKSSDYNLVWVDVAKNKSGETGKVLLDFEPKYYHYQDAKKPMMDEDDDKPIKTKRKVNNPVATEEQEKLRAVFGGSYVDPDGD